MKWLKVAGSELIGLFVDDGSLATAIVAWLAGAWAVLPRLGLPSAVPPTVLFLGLAAILAENVVRGAGRSR